ncbi:MAG: M6 family metalloprotease domain-containing protein [Planctomycetes bacterium]|nr:M6 family metalloprotease domain-containing protein [Planctomycetota bacterium]
MNKTTRVMMILSLLVLVIVVFNREGFCIMASPQLHELAQPNGIKFFARQWGDERAHGWETEDRYTIIKNEHTNYWHYARYNEQGKLVCAESRPDQGIPPSGISKMSRPLPKKASKIKKAPSKVVPGSGTAKIPVILINYSDTTPTNTSSEFEQLLFGNNPFIATGPGSMKDYYEEISYGIFSVSSGPSGVSEWVTASNTHDYYGQNDSAGNDLHAAELVREAVVAADAAGFDFSQYDNDGDGKVDVVMIVHQGKGEEVSINPSDTDDIWSHRWDLTSAASFGDGEGPVSADGVVVDDYIIQPERYDSRSMITIGVFAHEFGHALGLPDLYDTDYTSSGVGEWCIMAAGSYNLTDKSGDTPAHMSAWCKYFLNWISPTEVIASTGTLASEDIMQAETSPDVYRLLENPNDVDWNDDRPGKGEYFLIENRQKIGFDEGLPSSGLLIWHIDESVLDNDNELHKLVDLEEADSLNELDRSYNYGDSDDPFPGGTNKTQFTDTTNPSSRLYNGNSSGVKVENISTSGSTMYADLSVDNSSSNGNTENTMISGYVYDSDKEPVEKAKVKCRGESRINDETDEDGYFEFGNLQEGIYKITVKKKGYKRHKETLAIEEGDEEKLEIVLEEK